MARSWYLAAVTVVLALVTPPLSGAVEHIDTVNFAVFHPWGTVPIGEPTLLGIFKQGAAGQIVVSVSGPHRADVEQVRVSIAGGAVVLVTARTEGLIDVGGGVHAGTRGDAYQAAPTMDRPCGKTTATARVFYRGGRDLVTSMDLYIDCSGPALRINAPSGGNCVRAGERLALRWTAADHLGIKGLSASLSPLIPVSPPSFTPPARLEQTVSEAAEWIGPHDRAGVIDAVFGAEDWVGNKVGKGMPLTLDGSAPPTIRIETPTDGQQLTTVDPIALRGPAADAGCGLDRIEIGMRRRDSSDPFRVLKTIREFPHSFRGPNSPTPRFTYQADLPPGTLGPGQWELRALATSTTGRSAAVSRHIRVTAGPGLAPAPPAGRQPLPGIPSHPPITIPR